MHRHAVIKETPGYINPMLPDDESLLIQLCEHLYRSGFLYDDATEKECREGEGVIRDFFEQEPKVFRKQLPRKRLQQFVTYMRKFGWSEKQLNQRLRNRVVKAFNQLALGAHHQFNIRYSIAQGLQQRGGHPLYDFLLYLESFHNLVLGVSSEPGARIEPELHLPAQPYTVEDLMRIRREAQEQLEGKWFVQTVLKQLAKQRGVSVESLRKNDEPEKTLARIPVKFRRPSQSPSVKPVLPARPVLTPRKKVHKSGVKVTEKPVEEAPVLETEIPAEKEQDELLLVPKLEEVEPGLADAMAQEDDGIVDLEEAEKVAPQLPKTAESHEHMDESSGKINDKAGPKITITTGPSKPEVPSAADLLGGLEEEDEDFEDEDEGLAQVETDETDVVFGTDKITPASMIKFVQQYPDSALKFLLRRNPDGRPLPAEFEPIYAGWEKRGLMRGRLRRHILQVMKWEDVPDLPIHELLGLLRNRLMDIRLETENA